MPGNQILRRPIPQPEVLMRYHYVWLVWSVAFLIPWLVLFLARPDRRRAMWRTSLATSLFGLTEPLFVPRYWNPPSLLELAQRTGFDVESLIFCFAIGGIGLVAYDALSGHRIIPVDPHERNHRRHRFHRLALAAPILAFVPLFLMPWNPIYPSIASLAIGALAGMACRPDLTRRMFLGGALFGALYAVFILGLRISAPGYIEQVWNLHDLSGVLLAGVPLEELLFGITFGMYWSGVYEHLTWHAGAHALLSGVARQA